MKRCEKPDQNAKAAPEDRIAEAELWRRSAQATAGEINARIQDLAVKNTPNLRAIRRRYSRLLGGADASLVLAIARELLGRYAWRSVAYEMILHHADALRRIGEPELEEFGRGIDSWWSVDSFARTLAGPAWRQGYVGDQLMLRWVRSGDRWWRRAALVSTVALNVRSQGGQGDTARTLRICRPLIDDRDEMVVKAMSWALRELVVHDSRAVEEFLGKYVDRLAPRVLREVSAKLETGLKNPRRGGGQTRRANPGSARRPMRSRTAGA